MHKTLFTLLLISLFIAAAFFGGLYFMKQDVYHIDSAPELVPISQNLNPTQTNPNNINTEVTPIAKGFEKEVARGTKTNLNQLPLLIEKYKDPKAREGTPAKDGGFSVSNQIAWETNVVDYQIAHPELTCVVTATTTPVLGDKFLPTNKGIQFRYSYCLDKDDIVKNGVIVNDLINEHGNLMLSYEGVYIQPDHGELQMPRNIFTVWNLDGRSAQTVIQASINTLPSIVPAKHCLITKKSNTTSTLWMVTPDSYLEKLSPHDPLWGVCGQFGPQNFGFDLIEQKGVLIYREFGQALIPEIDLESVHVVDIK